MGSPLYITAPILAQATINALAGAVDPVADADLLVTASGSTLIESIDWAVSLATLPGGDPVDAGQIAISLDDGVSRGILRYIDVPAWTGVEEYHGSIDLALALPDGWSIYVAHDLFNGAANLDITFTARGGVVG